MTEMEGYIPIEDGLRLYYQILGDGEDTLVIPPACTLLEDLRPLAETRRLIFYDPRGRGRSDRDRLKGRLWSDYQVRDYETVRQFFGLEQMSLLGWSALGGTAAIYAAQHPGRVKRLILMCPISPRHPAPYDDPEGVEKKEQSRLSPADAAALREKMASGEHIREPEAFCREFKRLITPMSMGRPEALARMKSDPCALPNEWWHLHHEQNELHVPPESLIYDWRELVCKITSPTLILHGLEDLLPLGSSAEWAALLPNARLVVFEHSGHYPYLEEPERFFEVVEQFLAKA